MDESAGTTNTVEANQYVGKVVIVYGTVKAITPSGIERILAPTSPVFAYDRIITESDGKVSIILDDPSQTQIDLGRMSDVIIDEDIFAGATQEEIAAAAAEVEQIQEALLAEEFDPTVELEAPAAGGSASAGGGHPVPDFARETHEGNVTSGAETITITGDTVDTIPGSAQPPDPSVSVAVNADGGAVPEGTDAVFTVTINDASEGAQLTLGLSDGTANITSDYNFSTFQYNDGSGAGWQEITGPITLTEGANSLLIRTDTVADNIDEPDETFSLTAQVANENGATASDSAIATIIDADTPSVQVSDDSKIEGETEIFTVTVQNAADGAQLTLSMTNGSAESTSDYHATTFQYDDGSGSGWQDVSGPITLTEGNHTLQVRTDTVIDNEIEGEENFFLNASLTNEGGGPVSDTGEGIILDGTVQTEPESDPDPDPEINIPVTVNVSNDSIPEGQNGVFTVTVNNAPANAQLNLDMSDGSAYDDDYFESFFEYNDGTGWQAVSGPIDIPVGESSIQIRTDTVDDTFVEPDETFFVNASVTSDDGAELASNSGTGTILDNDVPPPPENILADSDESVSTPEDTPATGNVLLNTTNPDGPNVATVTQFTIAGDSNTYNAGDIATISGVGTLTIDVNGDYTFNPAADFNGPVPTATYTVTDGTDADNSTLTINVGPVNDDPDAINDTYSTDEDTPVTTGNVLVNDDLGDTPTTITDYDTSSANGGTVSYNNDGTFEYNPAADFNGADTFTYTITDADGQTDTATVTINVGPVNDDPDAINDTYATDEDTPVTTGNVLVNDDLGDTPTTITDYDTSSANGGTVSYNNDGTFEYNPAADFNGADTFTYTITDADGQTDTATVTINVGPVNDDPDAINDTYSTDEDTPVTTGNVLVNDDLGDTPTTITDYDTSSANGGTVSYNNDGTFEYNPAADFNGADTFTYTITDADGQTDTATVTINVGPVNDDPDAINDTYSTDEDTPVTTGNVLVNDDLGDTPTTITDYDTSSANGGTVSYNNDGTFEYNPAADFNGADTFTYTITDADGQTDTATVTINVGPVNDDPDAINDTYSTDEDTPVTTGNVLVNDDLGDTPTTITDYDTSSANGGTVSYNNDGTFEYNPAADFNGADTFTYTITDADGQTDTATVTINVGPVNDDPDAINDTYSTDEDTPVTTGNVLVNDDLGDTPTTITDYDTSSANGGTVSYNNDGTFEYNPAADFNGADTFTYTITDADGQTDTATVTINVGPVNDDPDAINDTYATDEDTPVTTGNVLVNDDLGDTPTTITDYDTSSANGGTVSYNNDGTFEYNPAADFNGADTFTYTITDADGQTDTATVTINVGPVNDDPDAINDTYATDEDTPVTTGNVLVNDDLGDTPTTITDYDTSSANGGTVSYNNDGTFEYNPAADFNGADTFTYTITDADGQTDTATVTINVGPVNDDPDAINDTYSTDEDTPVTTGNVLVNDDLGDTPTTITDYDTSSANGGTVSYNNDGTFEYNPAADFNGADTFTYTITDADGQTDTATVTINVGPVNDDPDAINDTYATDEDTPVTTGNVLVNDDLGDTPTTITDYDTSSANGGTVSYNNDGTFEYNPAADFNGADTFTYTITDADGQTDTATVTINVGPVNDDPDAINDTYSTDEDTPVTTGNVLVNDDLGDTPTTITDYDTSSANGGTVSYNNDGTFEYNPAADFNGADTFTYTITDADGQTDTATVTINVGPVNDDPDAINDTYSTDEDTPVTTGNVLVNDDLGDTPTTITDYDTSSANGGTVSYNNDGTFEYNPAADFNGADTFTYTITDADGQTDTATVTINVGPVNDDPDAINDTYTTDEDTPVTTGNVLVNDNLGDTPTTITDYDTSSANGGTVSYNNDGTFEYNPAADFNGADTFTYTITDADGQTDTATVTINVGPVNDDPDAINDTYTTDEDTPVTTGNVLVNDDLGDTPTTITDYDTSSANGGTVSYNNDGTFEYNPAADFNGADTFTYTITDADGQTDTATVTINVGPVNDDPDAINDTYSTDEDTPVTTGNVLVNDDLGDTPTTITDYDTSSANGGTVSYNNDGTFEYNPAADFNGADTFTYTITDADGQTDTATVTINVGPVNDDPDAINDTYSTDEDTPVTTGNVLVNDDLGDTPTTITDYDTSSANGGTVSYNNDGTFEYNPAADFNGADTFTYTITDADGQTDTATVTINVGPVNDDPDAINDTYSTDEDTPVTTGNVLVNDDLGDTPTTITDYDTSSANGGTVSYNNDGTFEYNPAADFNGADTFTYTITDADGQTDTATVTINVGPVNDDPDAINDTYSTDEDTPVTTGNVLVNDDLGDTPTTITDYDTSSANGGTVSYNNDGTFEYNPAADFNGADTFTYTITDADGQTDTATVTINVGPVNDDPDAINDTYSTDEDTPVTTGNVLVNDDLGDTPTTITDYDTSSANGGTVSYNNDGTFEYNPAADFNGADTFTYTITDADGQTDTATVTINVGPVNDDPDAINDTYSTDEDTPVTTGNVLVNDDLGDTPTTITDYDTSSANGGTVSYNNDGTFEYNPAADFNGADTFTYTITDADGQTDTATVTINVGPVNDDPDAINDTYSTDEDTPVTTGNVLVNDDLGDTPTTITDYDTSSANGGTVSYNNDGTFEYNPAADFNGADTFTYTITDADGQTDTATVTINVGPVNDDPDAINDTYSTDEDTPVTTGNVLVNDDLGDTPTTITDYDTSSANGGTVSYNNDGTFEYNPAADFNGADTFTYTITDADGQTDTATVTINVGPVNDDPTLTEVGSGLVYESGLDEGTLPITTPPPNSITASGNITTSDIDGGSVHLFVDGTNYGELGGDGSQTLYSDGSHGTLVIKNDGSWTYTLDDNVSHDSNDSTFQPGEQDSFAIGVGSNSVDINDTQNLNINIVDDTIQVTRVSAGHIANESNLTLNGIFNVVGADNDLYAADLSGNTAPTNITSGGQAIHYYVDSNNPSTLLAVTDLADPSGSKVFTLSVDPNGDSYSLTTHAQIDTVTTYSFGLQSLSYPSGPVPEMYITDQGGYDSMDDIPPGEEAKILATTTDPYSTDTPDLVNGSGQGLGVDNQWIGDKLDPNDAGTDTPETLVLDFVNPVVAVEISIDAHGSGPAGVIWTAYSTGSESPVTDTAIVNSDGSFTIEGLGFEIDKIELSHDSDYDYYRVSDISISETSTENDLNLDFNVEVSDSDNDSTTASISIEFDGDNSMSGTLGEHDVFAGGPDAELFDSAQGLGDADIIDNYDSGLDSLIADSDDIVNP